MIHLTPPQILSTYLFTACEKDFMSVHKDLKVEDILSIFKTNSREKYEKLVEQIICRQYAKNKLPFFYNQTDFYFSNKLSLEQSSSELAAQYKSSLFKGNTFVDLTGGMGVDSFYFANQFHDGIVLEQNADLAKITAHNFACLNQLNIQFGIGVKAEEYIQMQKIAVDLVYIDPARRDKAGGKVFRLEDCEPNMIYLQDKIFEFAEQILIKTSPLLDIHLACQQLKYVKQVYVVSIDNECKELLFHLERNYCGDYQIHAVHLKEDTINQFSFWNQEEITTQVNLSEVKQFVYEPDASILKAGAFKMIAKRFNIEKLHMNSHLYTSDQLIDNFQGRSFEVTKVLKLDKRKLQEIIPDMKANLSIRNFPGSVAELRKKLGLKEGGQVYIFATTDQINRKILILTKKII